MPVKLIKRILATRIALYIDSGHRGKGGRVKLEQWLYKNAKTEEQRLHNKQALLVAGQRLADLQTDALYHNTDLPVPYKLESRVLVYLREFQADYSKTDGNKISAMIEKFVEFEKGTPIQFKNLNQNTVQDFRNLLVESFAPQTARAYFGKFKQIIKRANVDRYTTYNIENFKAGISTKRIFTKETLDPEDIKLLAATHCDSKVVKLAAIYCYYTGLDYADVYSLEWVKHIRERGMVKPRAKNGEQRLTPLHQTALDILKQLDQDTKYVFQHLPHRGIDVSKRGKKINERQYSWQASNETLKDLVKRAGIKKHITWHCLRHSFGTNTVGDDGDIAALLGHADTSMIKLYRHRKNEKLATVVNSLAGVTIK